MFLDKIRSKRLSNRAKRNNQELNDKINSDKESESETVNIMLKRRKKRKTFIREFDNTSSSIPTS